MFGLHVEVSVVRDIDPQVAPGVCVCHNKKVLYKSVNGGCSRKPIAQSKKHAIPVPLSSVYYFNYVCAALSIHWLQTGDKTFELQ